MFFFNSIKISRSKLKHKGLRGRSSHAVRVRPICPGSTMKPRLSARRNLGGNPFNIGKSITGIYQTGENPGGFHILEYTLHCQYHETEVQLSVGSRLTLARNSLFLQNQQKCDAV